MQMFDQQAETLRLLQRRSNSLALRCANAMYNSRLRQLCARCLWALKSQTDKSRATARYDRLCDAVRSPRQDNMLHKEELEAQICRYATITSPGRPTLFASDCPVTHTVTFSVSEQHHLSCTFRYARRADFLATKCACWSARLRARCIVWRCFRAVHAHAYARISPRAAEARLRSAAIAHALRIETRVAACAAFNAWRTVAAAGILTRRQRTELLSVVSELKHAAKAHRDDTLVAQTGATRVVVGAVRRQIRQSVLRLAWFALRFATADCRAQRERSTWRELVSTLVSQVPTRTLNDLHLQYDIPISQAL